jgi:hypothetical protein
VSADRSQAARRAALIRWSRAGEHDGRKQGEAGQAGLVRKLLEQVDPERRLSPKVRAQRLEQARRAHMIGLRRKQGA